MNATLSLREACYLVLMSLIIADVKSDDYSPDNSISMNTIANKCPFEIKLSH